jgi:multidrug resistance efflux pump
MQSPPPQPPARDAAPGAAATPARAAPAGADAAHRRRIGRALGWGMPALALILGIGVFVSLWRHPRTDDAYIRANLVSVAANVSGYVTRILVVDNQPVKQGDLLLEVDPRPFQIALQDAEAKLRLTNLDIQAYKDQIRSSEAAIQQARADAEYWKQHLARIEPLLSRQFVTPDQVEKVKSDLRVAQAKVAGAEADLSRAVAMLGDSGDVNVRRVAAEAAVENARLNLQYCQVRSPVDGFVVNMNISQGAYCKQGDQLFQLVDGSQWFLLASYQETELRRIEPGMEVDVWLMIYPLRKFKGVVQGVGWAVQLPYKDSGGTGVPAPEPTIDWVRLAQRFPVRITLEPFDPNYPYRMGATATAIVHMNKRLPIPDWMEKVLPDWIQGAPLTPAAPPRGSDL